MTAVVELAKMVGWLLALWLFGLAAIGLTQQAEQMKRIEQRRTHQLEVGPVAQPKHEQTSVLATVDTGCLSDVRVWE